MWNWIEDHRRKKILEAPFPAPWEDFLVRNVAHYQRLGDDQKRQLRELAQVFVAEKHWEGCGGLVLTDEMRVTIAAGACLLILALPHDLYRDVDSILVYPTTVITPERPLGVFEIRRELVPGPQTILGEAHVHGPVILVWDDVLRTARHPEGGHNLVYHEFAHKLDMLGGRATGTPPIRDHAQLARWVGVCSREFLRLRQLSDAGKKTFLDAYGAVNEAEFFAVITEQFFDQPRAMERHHPELYGVLREFYRQDPAASELP